MIVIPMAGESMRFNAAGYTVPKYMLSIAARPLFDWSVLSFRKLFDKEEFLFIARKVHDTANFLECRVRDLGIANASVAMLERTTAGQAETVEVGLAAVEAPDCTPITIFNIDTIRPNAQTEMIPGTAGWLETFSAPGDNWSFVSPEPNNPALVKCCTEKERVSDLCCTGLYGFQSKRHFQDALAAERKHPTMNELYVAPLYNHMIRAGHDIGWRAAKHSVLLSGTPTEYEALKSVDLEKVMLNR